MPDLVIILFYAWQLLLGTPETQIWSIEYYRPFWQGFIDSFNSIPLILLLMLAGWQAHRPLLLLFAASLLLPGLTTADNKGHMEQVEILFKLTRMEQKIDESVASIAQLQLRLSVRHTRKLGLRFAADHDAARLFGQGKTIDLVPDMRLNALVVRARPADLDTIEQLLKVLDQRTGPEEVEADAAPRIIPVYNTSATEVAAVVQQRGKYFAWVATDNGPERRPLVLGYSNDQVVEVKDGVAPGDHVVLNPRAVVEEAREAIAADAIDVEEKFGAVPPSGEQVQQVRPQRGPGGRDS